VGEKVPFKVQIKKDETVGRLKKLIKYGRNDIFANTGPNFLDLYHVDLAEDDNLAANVNKELKRQQNPLQVTKKLTDVFGGAPNEGGNILGSSLTRLDPEKLDYCSRAYVGFYFVANPDATGIDSVDLWLTMNELDEAQDYSRANSVKKIQEEGCGGFQARSGTTTSPPNTLSAFSPLGPSSRRGRAVFRRATNRTPPIVGALVGAVSDISPGIRARHSHRSGPTPPEKLEAPTRSTIFI